MTNGLPSQPRKEAYGFFVGPIDQQAAQRMANAINIATNNGIEQVHLLFQSAGGLIGDGVCIYNMIKNAPIDITLYNAGSVASIGVIAYLGGRVRKSTANAVFMIHKTSFSPVGATYDRLQAMADAAMLDDQRVEAILHHHVKLSPERWDVHKVADLWLSADEALQAGLVQEIGEFAPPKGQQMFYLGPP